MARARAELVDSQDNLAAAAALLWLRRFLGTKRGRNRVKPLSQSRFADRLATHLGTVLPQSTLSDWEGGEGVVPYAVLVAASRVLSQEIGRPVTVDEFLSTEFKKP
jgi:hypothetical protein